MNSQVAELVRRIGLRADAISAGDSSKGWSRIEHSINHISITGSKPVLTTKSRNNTSPVSCSARMEGFIRRVRLDDVYLL
jgi:hypothetical protein